MPTMPEKETCKNCEKSFDPSFEYCPYCGQEATDNLTFGILFSNTIENYFSIDARFFRSFIPLMLKPGVLARRFVDGKRLKYLHPAQFYLFISVLFFFLFSFSVRQADSQVNKAFEKGLDSEIPVDSIQSQVDSVGIARAREELKKNQIYTGMTDEQLEKLDSAMIINAGNPDMSFGLRQEKLDSLIANGASQEEKLEAMGLEKDSSVFTTKLYTQLLKLYEQRAGGILKTLYDTIPVAMFIMLPLFALLLKIFYWKRGTFAHHMVFSFYFFTFLFTTFCALIVANFIVDVPGILEFLILLSVMIYLMIALHNFYRSSWIGAFFKSGIISFMYMLFVVPMAAVGVIFVAFMLY